MCGRKIFENEQPKLPPSGESGCLGSIFYWLIDEVIRHIDKQKRGIQQFFHDEVASKFGMPQTQLNSFQFSISNMHVFSVWQKELHFSISEIDYSIGLKTTEEHRLARMTLPSWPDLFNEIYNNPQLMRTLSLQFFTSKVHFC